MKRFYLDRITDETGISGTGRVAEGVIFSNGSCAMVWLTQYWSVAVYPNIDHVIAIHGHNGKTKVVVIDADPSPAPPEL